MLQINIKKKMKSYRDKYLSIGLPIIQTWGLQPRLADQPKSIIRRDRNLGHTCAEHQIFDVNGDIK